MDKVERIKMVKAMEFIARNLNDEEIFMTWLTVGVGDGDIEYGNLTIEDDDLDLLDCYIDDATFADLMDTFLSMMKSAVKSGGLYCDGVVSKPEEVPEDDFGLR